MVGARVASFGPMLVATLRPGSLDSPSARYIRQVLSTLYSRCRNMDVTKDETALGSDSTRCHATNRKILRAA